MGSLAPDSIRMGRPLGMRSKSLPEITLEIRVKRSRYPDTENLKLQ